MDWSILPMLPEHWSGVREIYREGIATGHATFETEAPEWQKWDGAHRKDCRLVLAVPSETDESGAAERIAVVGWAALSPVSARRVYAGVAEVSVYIAAAARGRGIGKALLEELVRQSEASGVWTLQAGIFPENIASIRLHESCGFRQVGVRRRIGRLGDVWRDVLLLERRSAVVE